MTVRIDQADWRAVLAGFVSDLGTGDDRVPLERVLRRHVQAFEAVLATGRTWPQIAQALTMAGARHRRGQPMSAKQLRTVYSRSVDAEAKARDMPISQGMTSTPTSNGVPLAAPVARSMSSSPGHTGEKVVAIQPITEHGSGRLLRRMAEARAVRIALGREFEE